MSRSDKPTVRIPRGWANWRAEVRLAPVAMPVAHDLEASRATTQPLRVAVER